MNQNPPKDTRYNLVLPKDVYEAVKAVARDRNTSVLEVFKQFIRIGLMVVAIDKSPDKHLIIREGEQEREIIIL